MEQRTLKNLEEPALLLKLNTREIFQTSDDPGGLGKAPSLEVQFIFWCFVVLSSFCKIPALFALFGLKEGLKAVT